MLVVPDVLIWCPSAALPHWYKSPYAASSVLLVATWEAPKFLSIHILPVVGLVTTGITDGVIEFEAELAKLVPIVFVAVTVKVYAVPLVRPVTVIELAVPLPVLPPGLEVAV